MFAMLSPAELKRPSKDSALIGSIPEEDDENTQIHFRFLVGSVRGLLIFLVFCVVFFVLFVFVLCLVFSMLPFSLGCQFLIAPSVLSNISILTGFLIAPQVLSNISILTGSVCISYNHVSVQISNHEISTRQSIANKKIIGQLYSCGIRNAQRHSNSRFDLQTYYMFNK